MYLNTLVRGIDEDAVKAECYMLIKNCLMYNTNCKKKITCSLLRTHFEQEVHK